VRRHLSAGQIFGTATAALAQRPLLTLSIGVLGTAPLFLLWSEWQTAPWLGFRSAVWVGAVSLLALALQSLSAPLFFDAFDGLSTSFLEGLRRYAQRAPLGFVCNLVLALLMAGAVLMPTWLETKLMGVFPLGAQRYLVMVLLVLLLASVFLVLLLLLAPLNAVLANERLGLWAALKRAMRLTRRHRMMVLSTLILTLLTMFLLFVAGSIPLRFSSIESPILSLGASLGIWLAIGVSFALQAAVSNALYHALRVHADGYGEEVILAIFE
jgi:hypothetical protein